LNYTDTKKTKVLGEIPVTGPLCPPWLSQGMAWDRTRSLRSEIQPPSSYLNPLNTELNPICHLLALLEAHHIIHLSRIRVNIYLKQTWSTQHCGYSSALLPPKRTILMRHNGSLVLFRAHRTELNPELTDNTKTTQQCTRNNNRFVWTAHPRSMFRTFLS